MGKDIISAFRPALVLLALFTLLAGFAYPLALTGIGQALFPDQANGSLIRDRGQVIGSELIGQSFASPAYFHGRPSAAGKGYDASASSGSNLGPASKTLVGRVEADVATLRKQGVKGPIPADLVTASASGLDPHISPEGARVQVARVARTRNLPEAAVRAAVEGAIERPLAGMLGEPRVNILLLNRQLDRLSANRGP